jgi:hypothetical protein
MNHFYIFLIILPLIFYSCNVQCVYKYAYVYVHMYACIVYYTNWAVPGSSSHNVEHVTEVTSKLVTKLRAHTRIPSNSPLYGSYKGIELLTKSFKPYKVSQYHSNSQIHPSHRHVLCSVQTRLPCTSIASQPRFQLPNQAISCPCITMKASQFGWNLTFY